MRSRITIFLIAISVMLSACGAGSESAATSTPIPTDTQIVPPTLTATPTIPLAVLVVPADLDPETSNLYQKTVYDLAQASGFRFQAVSASEIKIQGDEINLAENTPLQVTSPVSSRILVLRNGSPLSDDSGVTFKEVEVRERGVYRVEVYLPQLGSPVGQQPWIISNPIFVR